MGPLIRFPFLAVILAAIPAISCPVLAAEVSHGSRIDASWAEPTSDTRADAWSNLRVQGSLWNIEARLRATHGTDNAEDSVSVDQRSFTIDTGALAVTGGNFYQTIGRGLIFRSFEQRFVTVARSDRALNLDRDTDGARIVATLGDLDLLAFSGRPTITPPSGSSAGANPLIGRRVDVVQTLSGDVHLLDGAASLGASILGADRQSAKRSGEERAPRQTLRSFRGSFPGAGFSVYAEWADLRWHGRNFAYGRGIYAGANLGISGWGASLEYKNYRNFNFIYQDLPTLTRTHSSVLLNTSTHVQKPQGEEGGQIEIVHASSLDRTTTLNLTGAWNEDLLGLGGSFRYREAFVEHRSQGDVWTWETFADWAEDTFTGDRNRWTGGFGLDRALDDEKHAILSNLELQRIDPEGQEHFTNGFVQAGVSRAGKGALAMRYQWTSRPSAFGDRTEWLAGTLELELSGRLSFFFFAGARPAGLVCSGGFCSFAPEFEGVETRLLGSF